MGLVAVAAGHAGLVHAALAVGAVFEDFVLLLAVGKVEPGAKLVGQVVVEEGCARPGVFDQPGAPGVAAGALIHLLVGAAEQAVGGGLRPAAAGAGGVGLAGAVASLAAHVARGPARAVGVAGVVVALPEGGGVAFTAHQVPVLVAAAPVQRRAGRRRVVGEQREPLAAPGIPGDAEGLQAAAGLGDEVLLQGVDAEAVAHREVGGLAVGAFGAHHEAFQLASEAGGLAGAVEAGVVEVGQHAGGAGRGHRVAVLGALEGGRLPGVAGGAFAVGDVAGPRLGLRRVSVGRQGRSGRQAEQREQGAEAHHAASCRELAQGLAWGVLPASLARSS